MDKATWKKISYLCSVILLLAALFFSLLCCKCAYELWIYKLHPPADGSFDLVGLNVLVALLCCGITFVLSGCSALFTWLSKRIWPGRTALLVCQASVFVLSLLATVLSFLLNR